MYPVFDAVFKSATTELKRQICFVNAFPGATKSDNLPREVYNRSVRSVTESGLYSQNELCRLVKGFDGQWFSCVCPPYKNLILTITSLTLGKA